MTKDEATQLFRSLQYETGLGAWHIELTFDRDDVNYGHCEAMPEYQTAKINIDLSATHHNIRQLMLHELAHCVVSVLAAMALDGCRGDPQKEYAVELAEDMVCTHLAKMPRFHHGSE